MNQETYKKFQDELDNVLNRYVSESDLTVSEAVAAIELLKAKVIEDWHERHRPKQD